MSNQAELDPRNKTAIDAALSNNWAEAVAINSALSEEYPDDTNVLNRLAHAYTELGQVNKAGSIYKKILEIDPYNSIANRNLDRLSTLRGSDLKLKENRAVFDLDAFIEEPGKTKTIPVEDLAMPKVLITLRTGDTLNLKPNKKGVTVLSDDNQRLGKLNDHWGEVISQALHLGSEFGVIVKSVKVGKSPHESSFSIFVRELKRSKKLAHPTFPIEDDNFTPFVREDTINYLKENENHLNNETAEDLEATALEEIHTDEPTPSEQPPPVEIEEPHQELIEDEEDFSPK